MVSEINFFLQHNTRPFSSLPDNLHKFFQWEEPIQRHLAEPICRTKVFQSSFFPCCIKIWTGLDSDLQNLDSNKKLKSKTLPFIEIKSTSIFSVSKVYGVKLLSTLRLNFSILSQHKVRHGFKDATNCMCDCGSATKTTLHFLLQCQQYQTISLELLKSIYNLHPKIKNLSNDKLLHLLLYRSKLYSFETNREIIKTVLTDLFFD